MSYSVPVVSRRTSKTLRISREPAGCRLRCPDDTRNTVVLRDGGDYGRVRIRDHPLRSVMRNRARALADVKSRNGRFRRGGRGERYLSNPLNVKTISNSALCVQLFAENSLLACFAFS